MSIKDEILKLINSLDESKDYRILELIKFFILGLKSK